MKRIKQMLVALGIVTGIGMIAMPQVSAVDVFPGCEGTSDSAVCGAKDKDNVNSLIKTIVDVLLFILGAISVLVIIGAGIMYATSAGDAARVKKAKDTLMYAVIGLVVALLAYGIVSFVLTQIGK